MGAPSLQHLVATLHLVEWDSLRWYVGQAAEQPEKFAQASIFAIVARYRSRFRWSGL